MATFEFIKNLRNNLKRQTKWKMLAI
jgi:hypothetical protein